MNITKCIDFNQFPSDHWISQFKTTHKIYSANYSPDSGFPKLMVFLERHRHGIGNVDKLKNKKIINFLAGKVPCYLVEKPSNIALVPADLEETNELPKDTIIRGWDDPAAAEKLKSFKNTVDPLADRIVDDKNPSREQDRLQLIEELNKLDPELSPRKQVSNSSAELKENDNLIQLKNRIETLSENLRGEISISRTKSIINNLDAYWHYSTLGLMTGVHHVYIGKNENKRPAWVKSNIQELAKFLEAKNCTYIIFKPIKEKKS